MPRHKRRSIRPDLLRVGPLSPEHIIYQLRELQSAIGADDEG